MLFKPFSCSIYFIGFTWSTHEFLIPPPESRHQTSVHVRFLLHFLARLVAPAAGWVALTLSADLFDKQHNFDNLLKKQ